MVQLCGFQNHWPCRSKPLVFAMSNSVRRRGASEASVSEVPRAPSKNRPLKMRGWASKVVRRRGGSENRIFEPHLKSKNHFPPWAHFELTLVILVPILSPLGLTLGRLGPTWGPLGPTWADFGLTLDGSWVSMWYQRPSELHVYVVSSLHRAG